MSFKIPDHSEVNAGHISSHPLHSTNQFDNLRVFEKGNFSLWIIAAHKIFRYNLILEC